MAVCLGFTHSYDGRLCGDVGEGSAGAPMPETLVKEDVFLTCFGIYNALEILMSHTDYVLARLEISMFLEIVTSQPPPPPQLPRLEPVGVYKKENV